MKIFFHNFVLVTLNILLLTIITILSVKIIKSRDNKSKPHYVTRLYSGDLMFSETKENLKYFFESIPNNIQIHTAEWLGYKVQNRINSDGLNDNIEYKIEKDDSTYRIITIGDSFTFGLYVQTKDNYPEQLEVMLNSKLKCNSVKKFEVINLGENIYDIEYASARFIKRGLKYNPDLVLWLINEHNFTIINEFSMPILLEMQSDGIKDFNPVTGEFSEAEELLRNLRTDINYNPDFILKYNKNVIDRFLKSYQNDLFIFSFPKLSYNFKKILYDYTKFSDRIHYSERLTEIQSAEKFHFPDYHPNKAGYHIIAEDLFNYLQSNFLTNCI